MRTLDLPMGEPRHSARRAGKPAKARPTKFHDPEIGLEAESRLKKGRERLTVRVQAEVFHRDLTSARLADKRPCLVHPSVTRTELKLEEAKYFHKLLSATLHHEAAILFHLDATLAAIDATIETIKSECGKVEGFAAWQRTKYDEAEKRHNLSVFRVLRGRSLHMGLESPRLHVEWESRQGLDGSLKGVLVLKSFRLVEHDIEDPVQALANVIARLEEWVREAKQLGFLRENTTDSSRRTSFRAFKETQPDEWRELKVEDTQVGVRALRPGERRRIS